jgi:hypothetical protein
VVDRVAAAAAHAHHLDHRVRCLAFQQLDHRSSPLLWKCINPVLRPQKLPLNQPFMRS